MAIYLSNLAYSQTIHNDFCTREWHTKWNSYWHDDTIDYEEGSSVIRFLTAWSAPDTIVKRLSEMFPDAEFEHRWNDEDITYFEKLCKDWGVRCCGSWEQYNSYINELGEDAVRNAFHTDEPANDMEIK
ncbi:MAG: hypothetical protein A2Y17_00735 [Clostridiales bacterium GWF2_38_85]|nr:MAG: hypothetical protein A2Y17_00735 [Clostridiales bacterium GWF2_38_85]